MPTQPLTSDYRIFVGAFPGGELGERIQALRARHDAKTARITRPHVTLAGTYWCNGPATPENEAATIAALSAVAQDIQPFDLILGGVAAFPPDQRVLYLAVEKTAGLLAARQLLLNVMGRDKYRNFTPHVTLTMRLNFEQSNALLAELQQHEWHAQRVTVNIDRLWLMQRGPRDPAWRPIHSIPLGRPADHEVTIQK